MTVIAAIEHGKNLTIACDSFVGNGAQQYDLTDRPKWTSHRTHVIATAGAFRPGQLAEMTPMRGKQGRGEDDLSFLLRALIEPIRTTLQQSGQFDPTSPNGYELGALVLFRGGVYTMDAQLGLWRTRCGFAATGAGEVIATSVLASNQHLKTPEARLTQALKICEERCPFVKGPMWLATF